MDVILHEEWRDAFNLKGKFIWNLKNSEVKIFFRSQVINHFRFHRWSHTWQKDIFWTKFQFFNSNKWKNKNIWEVLTFVFCIADQDKQFYTCSTPPWAYFKKNQRNFPNFPPTPIYYTTPLQLRVGEYQIYQENESYEYTQYPRIFVLYLDRVTYEDTMLIWL